jgi:putative hydrolase
MKDFKLAADLHVHTTASGHAYSTVEEYAARAKKIGLKAFAITDHGPAMPGGPHLYHFYNMRMVPEVFKGVRIYKGAEVNIINDRGDLDVPDDLLAILDIVTVAMHPRVGYESRGEAENTKVLLKALRNRKHNRAPGQPYVPRFYH